MKKIVKSVMASLLSLTCVGMVACDIPNLPQGGLGGDKNPVEAQVKIARSSDKILQAYPEDTSDAKEFKERFMGKLTDEFSFTTYKNEHEAKQIIITPEEDVNDYTIEISDFVNGENKISKDLFEVKHEYYHKVESIYEEESTMLPGYYPDALIPIANAKEYGLTKIKAGENQGVYVSLKTPKDAVSGTYTGTIKVLLDGKISNTLQATINVMDYTLPDEATFKTLMGTDSWYMTYGELDNTQEMFDKYLDALEDYRISNGGLSSLRYAPGNEYVEDVLIKKALEKINDPECSTFVIPTPTSGHSQYSIVLNEDAFNHLLAAYIDASIENNVNLFKKIVVSMGNIIDEAELAGYMDRAYYVAEQYEKCLAWAVNYAKEKGASEELVEMIEKLPNVFTSPYSTAGEKMLEYSDNIYYCPTVDALSTSAAIQRYQELENGFWFYTCVQPEVPYPTYHVEDNGTSARALFWMAKEYNVQGYLTWDTVAWYDYVTKPNGPLYGIEIYENVHNFGGTYGDGVLLYPGKVFGVDGPVASLRLPIMRDGIEEYEAMADLEKKYAAMSESYGVNVSAKGVLDELYSKLYHNVKVYCSSETLDTMHVVLGKLLEAANKGIAVSDFVYNADGTIIAKIYAPSGTKSVTLNGEKVNGVSKDGVYTANISGGFEEFNLVVDESSIVVPISAVKSSIVFEPQNVQQTTVYTTSDETSTNQPVGKAWEGKEKALVCQFGANENRISISNGMLKIDKNTNTIIMDVYSDKTMNVTISLIGNNRKKQADIYTLQAGWNTIRIDCIYDLDLEALKNIQYLDLKLDKTEASTFAIGNIAVLG